MARLIALTGFMGSGKSAIGRELAQQLRWDFLDLDDLLEEAAGIPISRIFAEKGEAGFRELELAGVKAVVPPATDTVLALGGGTLTIPEARELLRESAFLVHLDVDADTCWGRVQETGSRPLARERSSFDALEKARRPAYLAAADLVVDGCGRVEEITRRIREALPGEVGESAAPPPRGGRTGSGP
jgi:shikimate kinase